MKQLLENTLCVFEIFIIGDDLVKNLLENAFFVFVLLNIHD